MNEELMDFLKHQMPLNSNLYIFSKDRFSRYTYCNENLARIADVDSPHHMVGKTDHDLIWRKQADLFQRGDFIAMKGDSFVNIQEPLQLSNNMLDILISKYPLKNKHDHCAGITAYFIDITGNYLIKKNGRDKLSNYYLGPKFDNKYLTKREVIIIKHLSRNSTMKNIAKELLLSPRTIESHLVNIKNKLKVTSKAEIIPVLIENGLTQILYPISS